MVDISVLEDNQCDCYTKQLGWLIISFAEQAQSHVFPFLQGHNVPKDTVIFVNNHKLNMSEELWEEPESFKPERFLDSQGNFSKPAHFQPFSMGKRSCMGYKMVQNVAFSLAANLILHFDLHSPQWSPEDIPLGMLALPPQPFQFTVSTVKGQPPYSLFGQHRSSA